MKKSIIHYITALSGALLLVIGLYLMKTIVSPYGIMRTLPYICIGLGCGVFGHGIGEIISYKTIRKNPDIERQIEIDKRDERNIAIGNRAKAKAYDMMTFLFGGLLIAFALMEVDMIVLLILVFFYLFIHGYGIYYRFKFDKEM